MQSNLRLLLSRIRESREMGVRLAAHTQASPSCRAAEPRAVRLKLSIDCGVQAWYR